MNKRDQNKTGVFTKLGSDPNPTKKIKWMKVSTENPEFSSSFHLPPGVSALYELHTCQRWESPRSQNVGNMCSASGCWPSYIRIQSEPPYFFFQFNKHKNPYPPTHIPGNDNLDPNTRFFILFFLLYGSKSVSSISWIIMKFSFARFGILLPFSFLFLFSMDLDPYGNKSDSD